jgi:tRNA pseudouridine synthase 8/2,5-diamino-6-(5-phospho-D-ribitylamino)-pyrimidin-4(3H)-one deaminase
MSATATIITTDEVHLSYLRLALSEAQRCEPTSTAFCIGAVIVSPTGDILSTGFSRELPGNTHAEQCALEKLQSTPLSPGCSLYTTMEPCTERLSGNQPCLNRILELEAGTLATVYIGVREPDTFIHQNMAEEKLRAAGISYVHVTGLEKEILEVAKRGHAN